MEPIIHFAPYTGWVYPNETVFEWSVLIAVYPYLTGLVAGAFTVSSLYQVFGFERLKPVAHLALLTSLSFMIFVPTPLLLHLGHPERAFNSTITPHLTSAMAMFGFFASFYVALLILEGWFAYRPFIVEQAQKRTDLLGKFYRLLTLGSYDVSEHAMRYDRKWIFALAVIGIPAAHGLHGYVGFMYGSLKSREWWSSDLMPVIFLFSAIISGVSLLAVLYVASCKMRKIPDRPCVPERSRLHDLGLHHGRAGAGGPGIRQHRLQGPRGRGHDHAVRDRSAADSVFRPAVRASAPSRRCLWLSYMIWRGTTGKALVVGVTICACLVLFSVFMMRWNVVIGGQEISKTGKGLLSYHLPFFGKEGALVAAILTLAPLGLLYVLTRLFPPWADETTHAHS